MTNKSIYTEENIRSLDWKEHIRMRPGMYIGKLGDGSSQMMEFIFYSKRYSIIVSTSLLWVQEKQ